MSKYNFREYIEANTLRCEYTRRGGGIEIDASEYLELPGAKISAYQNYLGGGLLGSVQSDRNFSITSSKKREARAAKLADELKRYFHEVTNAEAGDYDEWSESSYEANQARPGSAY